MQMVFCWHCGMCGMVWWRMDSNSCGVCQSPLSSCTTAATVQLKVVWSRQIKFSHWVLKMKRARHWLSESWLKLCFITSLCALAQSLPSGFCVLQDSSSSSEFLVRFVHEIYFLVGVNQHSENLLFLIDSLPLNDVVCTYERTHARTRRHSKTHSSHYRRVALPSSIDARSIVNSSFLSSLTARRLFCRRANFLIASN